MASEFSRLLDVKHHIIKISKNNIIETFEEALQSCEIYHLYNVYCAVGMHLLGKKLADSGIENAIVGEGVNEALGDYKDWVYYDNKRKKKIILQSVDSKRLEGRDERKTYVWGQSIDKGKYNRHLGSGLPKHATSRMIKPFLNHKITLECPYYDREVLSHMISLTAKQLHYLGGKPGLIAGMFSKELKQLGINIDFLNKCKKVRFQDASEGGENGITPILLVAGYDQKKTIELFNKIFKASLDPQIDSKRMAQTTMDKKNI